MWKQAAKIKENCNTLQLSYNSKQKEQSEGKAFIKGTNKPNCSIQCSSVFFPCQLWLQNQLSRREKGNYIKLQVIWNTPFRPIPDSSPLIWGEHAVQHWPKQSWHYFTVSTCFPFSLGAKLEKKKLSWARSSHASYFNVALQSLSITSQQEWPNGAFPRAPPHAILSLPGLTDTPTAVTQALGHKETKKYILQLLAILNTIVQTKGKTQNWKNELLSSSFGLKMPKLLPVHLEGAILQLPATGSSRCCREDPAVATRMNVWGRRCTIK